MPAQLAWSFREPARSASALGWRREDFRVPDAVEAERFIPGQVARTDAQARRADPKQFPGKISQRRVWEEAASRRERRSFRVRSRVGEKWPSPWKRKPNEEAITAWQTTGVTIGDEIEE